LVGVAGLLHDIGHYAFSHVFDEVAAKDLGLPDHEQRGVAMVREMVIKYSIPLTTAEVDAICGMILGDSKQVEPKWLCAFVHNRVNELDCDKLDYLQRDSYHSGLSRQIQVDRLRKHMRVLPVGGDLQLCFHRKVYMQIADVFYARYRNFRELYRQKTVIAIDVMIDDLFRIVKPVLKYFVDRKRRITDSLIQNLPDLLPLLPPGTLAEAEQQKALALWQRIQTRKLYKATLVEPADKGLPGSLIIKVRLSLSSLADNPLDHIYFYDDSGSVAHLAQETLVKLLPATVSCCTETLHYHISKT
jgi:HD superfamily phosphohydrolase